MNTQRPVRIRTEGGGTEIRVRTISTLPPISPERLHDGRPVLEAIGSHDWESRVVLNPAAVLIDDLGELEKLSDTWRLDEAERSLLRAAGGACVLLYRAQGDADPLTRLAASCIGMAVCTPTLELVHRWPEPILRPDALYHDLGIEDPRCTKIGDTYYLHYTGYYRGDPKESGLQGAPDFSGKTHVCLATTTDFLQWEHHGPVPGDINFVLNKNAALISEQVDGRWLLMHRPMEGEDAMTIHLAEAHSPTGPWKSIGALMQPYSYREFVRTWIGAAGPPVSLGDGRFLVVYHVGNRTAEGTREYDLAAALVEFSPKPAVRGRIEPIMRPTHPSEQLGDPELGVDNVLFSCANYRWKDQLIIPYAGADSRICGASVSLRELVLALELQPPE